MYWSGSRSMIAARSVNPTSGPATTDSPRPSTTSATAGPTMPAGRRTEGSSAGAACQNALFHALTIA